MHRQEAEYAIKTAKWQRIRMQPQSAEHTSQPQYNVNRQSP